MSMQNIGCSGYVVKASLLTKLLPVEIQQKFTEAITNHDVESVDEILHEHTPNNFPEFESSFVLRDEDEADNLEKGEVYVCFQDADLYILKPRHELEYLIANGIIPQFERWVTWG